MNPTTLTNLKSYLIVLLLTITVTIATFYCPGFSWYLPRSYNADILFGTSGIKTIIDTGWVLTNPYLSAPGIFQLYDFPICDSTSVFIIYLLSFFSHHYAVVMNLFYFLTFPLAAIFSLYAFLKLELKPLFAISAALLYTFLPY